MAIPWIDLSNVKKWLSGSGSGTTDLGREGSQWNGRGYS